MASKNVKHFEFKLGRMGVFLFTAGMALLVFFVFLFGVEVGKHIDTYPEKFSRDIPDMIRDVLPGGTDGDTAPSASTARTSPPAGKEDFDLTFYDSLAKKPDTAAGPMPLDSEAKQPAGPPKVLVPLGSASPGSAAPPAQQPLPVNEGNPPVGPPPPVSSSGSSAGKVTLPTKQPAPVKEAKPPTAAPAAPSPLGAPAARSAAPTAKQVPSPPSVPREAAPPKPPKTKERYAVQVASCKEKEKAQELGRKIKALGYAPRITMVNLPSKGTWYRVMIDGFTDRPHAEKAVAALSRKIGTSGIIHRLPAH